MGDRDQGTFVDVEIGLLLCLPHGGTPRRSEHIVGCEIHSVFGVDAAAGKDPHSTGELELRVAPQHQSLNASHPVADQQLVKAGTDITGFGLLGHLTGLCRESRVTARLDHTALPVIDPQVLRFIENGCVPGGTKTNLEACRGTTHFADTVPEAHRLLLADAQTSGGLLLAVPPANLDAVLAILAEADTPCAVQIGELATQGKALIEVR